MQVTYTHPPTSTKMDRRRTLQMGATGLLAGSTAGSLASRLLQAADHLAPPPLSPRPWITVRGLYGGFPDAILQRGQTPADFGINAIWVGSGSLNRDAIARYHTMGVQVFAEFNSMHFAGYLKNHPDAAPIGVDGRPAAPPHGWQGVSPFHPGYRQSRMDEFRRVLETFEVDGIWLDYHHAHASWERDPPALPDTDFSPAALRQFRATTGIELPADPTVAASQLLGGHRDAWTQFRCDVFTDWVRQYREILNTVRPRALLGTFHCPWSPEDFDGAMRHKLAIDLPAQAKHLDVLSIMPYHARFGHGLDPSWIARQTERLGQLLQLQGTAEERLKIWPIVQLADWGDAVPVSQVEQVLEYGTRPPATGIMAFHWSGISQQPEKLDALGQAYRAMCSPAA
ncbi:MAG: hypothetical protein AB7O38_28330 [Pirellulaceae bacterium]